MLNKLKEYTKAYLFERIKAIVHYEEKILNEKNIPNFDDFVNNKYYMDYFRQQLIQNASLECKIRITVELMNPRVSNFKIGKTVDTAQERYEHDEEYREKYDEIKTIYETGDKALVDELEKILIRDYMMTYPTRCDNKQMGSGPDCSDSDSQSARIYMVVKYKK